MMILPTPVSIFAVDVKMDINNIALYSNICIEEMIKMKHLHCGSPPHHIVLDKNIIYNAIGVDCAEMFKCLVNY